MLPPVFYYDENTNTHASNIMLLRHVNAYNGRKGEEKREKKM